MSRSVPPSYAVAPTTGTNPDVAATAARERGEENVARICHIVDANDLECETIARIEAKIRHGYKFINLTIRKDGLETTFEGDWLARLFRAPSF